MVIRLNLSIIQGLVECVYFRSDGITKQKSKDEQDQENPNDFRDPSVEQNERLGAVDKDEEEEGIVHEDTEVKNPFSEAPTFRELICVDEASKVFMVLLKNVIYCNNPTNSIIVL